MNMSSPSIVTAIIIIIAVPFELAKLIIVGRIPFSVAIPLITALFATVGDNFRFRCCLCWNSGKCGFRFSWLFHRWGLKVR